MKGVELCFAAVPIAIEADAVTFPVAAAHLERSTSSKEMLVVQTIVELVAIGLDVKCDAQPYLTDLFLADDLAHAVIFYVDAVRADTNAPVFTSDTEQTGEGACLEVTTVQQRGGLTLIAHRLLR